MNTTNISVDRNGNPVNIGNLVKSEFPAKEANVVSKQTPNLINDVTSINNSDSSLVPLKPEILGENKMAEVDTIQLSSEHSDIRREAVEHTNEIVREGLKGNYNTLDAIKDSRFETVSRVENSADRLERGISDTNFNLSSRVENANDRITKDVSDFRGQTADRFFQVARDTSDLRAQVAQVLSETRLVGANTAKDNEIAVLRNSIENQKNTQYLADKIVADGEKTRGLINDLKTTDLNRLLIERNTELTCCEHDKHHWRHYADQAQWGGQFASLQNQLQAFASQLQETRQGMVNFGTMAGVGQSSTSNNVR